MLVLPSLSALGLSSGPTEVRVCNRQSAERCNTRSQPRRSPAMRGIEEVYFQYAPEACHPLLTALAEHLSHVRFQGAARSFLLRRRGLRRSLVRTAGDKTRRRRLNKLSCADWVPHDRGSVSGLPRSKVEHRSGGPAHNRHEGSPPWSCLQQCAPRIFRPPFSLVQFRRPGQMSSGCATRAIAVVTTTFGLPIAARRRYRAHNRTCAFQAMSLIAAADSGSRRS